YAWAPIGDRARRRDFFVRGTRYSILPALSLDGVLRVAVQDRSYKGDDFFDFIESLLDDMRPFPEPNSVIVCDNASIHKQQELRELGFSAMKAWIRRNRDYVQGELSGRAECDPYSMLWDAVYETMTAEHAFGWFRHSGYV
ncbi:hypothetical protein EXIGLDRAFT_592156, partial [Exidia glandulosa HHB12029]